MIKNKFKIIDWITEFVMFRSPLLKTDLSGVSINIRISSSSKVCDLGVTFDNCLSLDAHISNICRSTHFHLRNIGRNRALLTFHATAQLIHALKVWCNALYLLHKYINSHESRFNLFGLLTNSTQRICLVARAGLELVTFRSQSRRFPATPHLITTRLDFCNNILHNLLNNKIERLQRIQNQAARMLTRSPRRNHITPVKRAALVKN